MSLAGLKHSPITTLGANKRDVRTQFGALCYRVHDGRVQILLITSRGTGRWIIPKGWPMDGETPAGAAATEAYEEAGVQGKVSDLVLGFYSYNKGMDRDHLPCVVAVFPIRVKKLLKSFPESGERKRRWVTPKKAASMIDEPELRRIIRHFDPKALKI